MAANVLNSRKAVEMSVFFGITHVRAIEGFEMQPFVYNSPDFQKELADSPHLAGEVNFLTSIAERVEVL